MISLLTNHQHHALLVMHDPGTSINPMLRAAHLAADPQRKVMLVVPWLTAEEQARIYPAGLTFSTQEEHAEYILNGEKRSSSSSSRKIGNTTSTCETISIEPKQPC